MVTRIVDPPAIGDSFFNREELIDRIISRLKSSSILLVAPRRFGKTSIMLKVKEELNKKNAIALYLDVEWVSNPSDFVTEILCKTAENTRSSFANRVKQLPKIIGSLKKEIESVEIPVFRLKLRKELKDSWMEKGREVFQAFQELDSDFVLFVDEFPLMIHNMLVRKKLEPEEIRNFLSWLRSMRMETNVKMVFGGSIGIDYILQRLKASASINDFERIVVGPFNQKNAAQFISLLFRSEGNEIDDKNVKKIMEILGVPIPYFIQIMVTAILTEMADSKTPITPKIVENVYRKRVLGIECRSYFEHYFQRLSIYYSQEDAEICKKLLKELAIKGNMTKTSLFKAFSLLAETDDVERFNFLISDLENDFYIVFNLEKESYVFATKVLRDLWLRRYEVLE